MRAARQRPTGLQARAGADDVAIEPGAITLKACCTLLWQESGAGVLRVDHGRLWITFDQPHAGSDGGDHFVAAGESLELHAGERALLEPVRDAAGALGAVVFAWQPIALRGRAAARVQALADLRAALALAAGAGVRLLSGTMPAGTPSNR